MKIKEFYLILDFGLREETEPSHGRERTKVKNDRDPASIIRYPASGKLGGIGAGLRFAGSVLLDLCLPRSCAGCQRIDNRPQSSWCRQCWNEIPWAVSPLCPICGRPFRDAPDSLDHLCGECIESVFHFDTARSAVLHEGIIRARIHQFKFGAQMEWAPPLVELLKIAHAGWGLPAPDLVVPVPLHLKRLKERGFNQSGLLAGEFARKLRVAGFIRYYYTKKPNPTSDSPQAQRAPEKREGRIRTFRGAGCAGPPHPPGRRCFHYRHDFKRMRKDPEKKGRRIRGACHNGHARAARLNRREGNKHNLRIDWRCDVQPGLLETNRRFSYETVVCITGFLPDGVSRICG